MRTVDKPIAEKTKGEIEQRLATMGDYVRMSYLQRALGSGIDLDTRKFVMLRLAGIYEGRKMFLDAARMVKSAAEINTTYKDKITDFMKAVNLYIKGADYLEAERLFAQALALGNNTQKKEMKENLKQFYITQAKVYLTQDRRNYSRIVYEKALSLDLNTQQKKEVQEALLALYDKLGMVREYYTLRDSM